MNGKKISVSVSLLVLSAMCLTTVRVSLAGGYGHDRPSNCERTADTMLRACKNDIRDDYLTTQAACLNMSDRDERRACFIAARETRVEERENCGAVHEARSETCELLGEDRYDPDPIADPAVNFIDPDLVPDMYPANPYVSVVAGHTFVLGNEDERVIVHVTEDSREILGVLCRIVVDIVVDASEENGVVEFEPVEVTQDWFAQSDVGDVYYCGEGVQNFEDGILRDLDGAFEAGRDNAKGGVLTRAFPIPGEIHRQEYALGEAEDLVQYVSTNAAPTDEEGGDNESFPCAPDLCLKTFDFATLDPESTEFKYYLPGTGFVLAIAIDGGVFTGERESLLCVGDSLDVLSNDPSCDIGDAEALLEALCKFSPDAFCE